MMVSAVQKCYNKEEMADFLHAITAHQDLSEEAQKKAGQAIPGSMTDEHENFVKLILSMLDKKEIDVNTPDSFLKMEHYNVLSEEKKAKVDVAKLNIADQLRHIVSFRLSKQTPDSAPQLETMIDYLWQMKERVEKEHGDVFKF